jgi:hypothetical protein
MRTAILLNGLALIAFAALTILSFRQAYSQQQTFERFKALAGDYPHDTYVVDIGYQNAIVMLVPSLFLLVGLVLQIASYRRDGK